MRTAMRRRRKGMEGMMDDVMRAAVAKNMPWTLGSSSPRTSTEEEPLTTQPQQRQVPRKTRLGGR